MPDRKLVATHYTRDELLEAISARVMELGKTLDTVRVEDLGPVDEFHIGGRIATENFLNQVALMFVKNFAHFPWLAISPSYC